MADQEPRLELIWETKVKKNCHHLLFSRKNWRKEMWSRRLREHPYMEVKIPSDTLHPLIHKLMTSGVPVPNEFACQYVWCELETLWSMDLIEPYAEGVERRLNTVIELFSYCHEDADETVKALLLQKRIVRKFYEGGF